MGRPAKPKPEPGSSENSGNGHPQTELLADISVRLLSNGGCEVDMEWLGDDDEVAHMMVTFLVAMSNGKLLPWFEAAVKRAGESENRRSLAHDILRLAQRSLRDDELVVHPTRVFAP